MTKETLAPIIITVILTMMFISIIVAFYIDLNRNKITYIKRKHRKTLQESLETEKEITSQEFYELQIRYEYYVTDERYSEVIFVAKDIENEEYTWLGIKYRKTSKWWKK